MVKLYDWILINACFMAAGWILRSLCASSRTGEVESIENAMKDLDYRIDLLTKDLRLFKKQDAVEREAKHKAQQDLKELATRIKQPLEKEEPE